MRIGYKANGERLFLEMGKTAWLMSDMDVLRMDMV